MTRSTEIFLFHDPIHCNNMRVQETLTTPHFLRLQLPPWPHQGHFECRRRSPLRRWLRSTHRRHHVPRLVSLLSPLLLLQLLHFPLFFQPFWPPYFTTCDLPLTYKIFILYPPLIFLISPDHPPLSRTIFPRCGASIMNPTPRPTSLKMVKFWENFTNPNYVGGSR